MSGEETLLVVNNVKHKKQEGSIVMTKTRFAWFREGYSSEMTVNLPYLSIKSEENYMYVTKYIQIRSQD